jgi:hypothetical protein
MKTLFLLYFILIFLPTPAHTQSNTIYFGLGYNIPTTTSIIGSFVTADNVKLNLSTFAKGMVYQAGYQYSITNNFALDINVTYLDGPENEYYSRNEAYFYFESHSTYSSSNISISPSLLIKFDIGMFSPYTKFGFSVNFISLNREERSSGQLIGQNLNYSYSNNYTLGFVGGFGINLDLGKSYTGFLEAQLTSTSYYPDKVEVTELNESGIGVVKNEYKLEDERNAGEEDVLLLQFYPFSAIAINMGLRYTF